MKRRKIPPRKSKTPKTPKLRNRTVPLPLAPSGYPELYLPPRTGPMDPETAKWPGPPEPPTWRGWAELDVTGRRVFVLVHPRPGCDDGLIVIPEDVAPVVIGWLATLLTTPEHRTTRDVFP